MKLQCNIVVCCWLLTFRTTLAHDGPHDGHIRETEANGLDSRRLGGSKFRCGTSEPNAKDLIAQARAKAFSIWKTMRKNGSVEGPSTRIIPVCFHVPQYRLAFRNRNTPVISNDMLQKQLDHLNIAYSSSSCCNTDLGWCSAGQCSVAVDIQFVMAVVNKKKKIIGTTGSTSDPGACVTRAKGARNMLIDKRFKEHFIKRRLRVGDSRTLNIYFIQPLDPWIYGYSTLPQNYAKQSIRDGVVITPIYIAEPEYPYEEGDAIVHEVGHWLGLYHTFQGGCTAPGDGIDDTPPENEPYYGCDPANRPDTCTNDTLPDPIFNFMDYSEDACLYEFTPGQAAAILEAIDTYRSPATAQVSLETAIQLSDGVPSDPKTLILGATQLYSMNVTVSSFVNCTITSASADGDLDLFMNWDGGFDSFDCQSETGAIHETCEMGPGVGVAYAFVYAGAASTNVTLTCTLRSSP